jgi:hypothetical protein
VKVNDPEKAMRELREELGMAAMTRSGPSSLRIVDAGGGAFAQWPPYPDSCFG